MTVTDGGRRPLQAGIEGDFALLLNPKETRKMKRLALVAAATVLGMATAFSAAARPGDDDLEVDQVIGGSGCQDDFCPKNGTQLSGIKLSTAAAVAIESPEAPPVPKYDQRETVQTAKQSANGTHLTGISQLAAHAECQDWACDDLSFDQRETVQTAKRSANGTHLTGISQLAAHAECQEWACDDLSFDLYNCDDGPCPKNGTQLTGIRLPIATSSEVQPVRKPDQRENLQMARPGQGGQAGKKLNDMRNDKTRNWGG
jgi:hypothetical protein